MEKSIFAQQPTPAVPISVDVIVVAATGDPLMLPAIGTRNTLISATSASCNQPALAVGPSPLVNPTIGEVDDPFNAGRKCRALLPTGLPNGTGYRAVATYTGTCNGVPCTSARSLAGVPPFNLVGTTLPPVVPTTLLLRP